MWDRQRRVETVNQITHISTILHSFLNGIEICCNYNKPEFEITYEEDDIIYQVCQVCLKKDRWSKDIKSKKDISL